MPATPSRPLEGVKVIEFSHMIMGPAAGLILADLGADVVKVEPPGGDPTRKLVGSGTGYFTMYNRNKRSVSVNLKSEQGRDAALKLLDGADVLIENFRPGTMDRLGLGYAEVRKRNPGLIYCSEKGFLAGPYEHRAAMDEVMQMMGGLALMTGPPGKPLRAGTSVIDMAGGMFSIIAVLAALYQRGKDGQGQHVSASLFESTVFLVGQHMAQKAVSGESAVPMPARVSPWAIYHVFETLDDPVFVGVVNDRQWERFCRAFKLDALFNDPALATNKDRVAARSWLISALQGVFKNYSKAGLMKKLEAAHLPFAPVAHPDDMFNDTHLEASGGLVPLTLREGKRSGEAIALPALPIEMDGNRFGLSRPVPLAGEHTREVLMEAGFSDAQVASMRANGAISDSQIPG